MNSFDVKNLTNNDLQLKDISQKNNTIIPIVVHDLSEPAKLTPITMSKTAIHWNVVIFSDKNIKLRRHTTTGSETSTSNSNDTLTIEVPFAIK